MDPLFEVAARPGRRSHDRLAGDLLSGLTPGVGQLRHHGNLRGVGPHHFQHPGPGPCLFRSVHAALARVHGPPILGHGVEARHDGSDPPFGQGAVLSRQPLHLGHAFAVGQSLIGGRSNDSVGQGEGPQLQRLEEGSLGVGAVGIHPVPLPKRAPAMAATSLM